jgi:hypothetical protein
MSSPPFRFVAMACREKMNPKMPQMPATIVSSVYGKPGKKRPWPGRISFGADLRLRLKNMKHRTY